MKNSEGASSRTRNWTFLLYPDSLPDDWELIIAHTHIKVILSPLHDRDVWDSFDERENPAHKAGTIKKPHYHAVATYDGVKSYKQVLEDFSGLGVSYVQQVSSISQMSRYLCHLDDDDKVKYSRDDIRLFNGAVVDLSKQLTCEEKRAIKHDIQRFIREHGITEYCDLIDWCDEHFDEFPEWYNVASEQTVFFTGYLRSIRGKAKAMSELDS